MLTIEKVMELMNDRNITKVALAVGVSRVYLTNLVNGKNNNPSYRIVKSLSDYLTKEVK